MSCKDPSCVNLHALETKGPGQLRSSGQKIGRRLWWFPAHSSNYSSSNRGKHEIDMVVIHSAEGYTGGLTGFQDPSKNASAHYSVQWNGDVGHMVENKDIAWHAGSNSINRRSIGIEHPGFAYAMKPGSRAEWSKRQQRASAKLVAKLSRKYGIPLNSRHIIAHDDVPNQTHTDPGPYWPWNSYLWRVRWYFYRPYLIAGVAVVALGATAISLLGVREATRQKGWEQIASGK